MEAQGIPPVNDREIAEHPPAHPENVQAAIGALKRQLRTVQLRAALLEDNEHNTEQVVQAAVERAVPAAVQAALEATLPAAMQTGWLQCLSQSRQPPTTRDDQEDEEQTAVGLTCVCVCLCVCLFGYQKQSTFNVCVGSHGTIESGKALADGELVLHVGQSVSP